MLANNTDREKESTDMEKAMVAHFRELPSAQQREVLDFVEFLAHKLATTKQQTLTLLEIAKLPIAERHKLLAPSISATADDFLYDPELTEFSILDGEDWEIEHERS
ncbi:DUF2281 domain-containing protein [Pseudanabaena sp. PCC 6802]|uniref:DUF2281 domain-containing protein n=1 Tax=Pseudanabaena sp. PCC 6802 TaxID=118173 RepID=UPI00036170CC|nr:DUF2281 domain-containing protein [Pseudanabaena sp. PCC 6802]